MMYFQVLLLTKILCLAVGEFIHFSCSVFVNCDNDVFVW